MTLLQSLGRVNVQSIIECAEKQKGRKYLLRFFKRNGTGQENIV